MGQASDRPTARTCALSRVRREAKAFQPTYLVSVLQSELRTPFTPPCVGRANHVRLRMEDTDVEGASEAPSFQHVLGLMHLASRLRPADKVLVHCEAGISRSTAAATLVLAFTGLWTLDEALASMLRQEPRARPNALLMRVGLEALAGRRPEGPREALAPGQSPRIAPGEIDGARSESDARNEAASGEGHDRRSWQGRTAAGEHAADGGDHARHDH